MSEARPRAKSPQEQRRAERLAAPRLDRERRTIDAMLQVYCAAHHASPSRPHLALCPGCLALQAYAHKRLALCPYGVDKPTCAHCVIHCYGKSQREAIRTVMRYAGPRMLWRHPVLAVAHLLDGRRLPPPHPARLAQDAAPGIDLPPG